MPIPRESVADFAPLGVVAFTTTRAAGTFGTAGADPVGEVTGRWWHLLEELGSEDGGRASRLASARQVHGTCVAVHGNGWTGLLRLAAADGHVAAERGTALAVTIADCVPIFIAHPSGVVALLHSGWRGTAAHILDAGLAALRRLDLSPAELTIHLGPAICGRCYEVGPEVLTQLTGRAATTPGLVDLRAILAEQARAAGVSRISVSPWCTRCHNDRFFSHRAGDAGRQLAIIVAPRTHAP
jgi:YfiH family protein